MKGFCFYLGQGLFFETGFLNVTVLTVLELALYTRVASNSSFLLLGIIQ